MLSHIADEVGCVHMSSTLIAFFDLVFHAIVNSHNTKQKNGEDC